MIDDQTFCTSCKQWLRHDKRYCPLYPEVDPPNQPVYAERGAAVLLRYTPGKKWKLCTCLVHTCFDNPEKVDPATAPTYTDFP